MRLTTKRDLRNWVDGHTQAWEDRTDADVDALTGVLAGDPDAPAWGADWTEYLDGLPPLVDLLPPDECAEFGPHNSPRDDDPELPL